MYHSHTISLPFSLRFDSDFSISHHCEQYHTWHILSEHMFLVEQTSLFQSVEHTFRDRDSAFLPAMLSPEIYPRFLPEFPSIPFPPFFTRISSTVKYSSCPFLAFRRIIHCHKENIRWYTIKYKCFWLFVLELRDLISLEVIWLLLCDHKQPSFPVSCNRRSEMWVLHLPQCTLFYRGSQNFA